MPKQARVHVPPLRATLVECPKADVHALDLVCRSVRNALPCVLRVPSSVRQPISGQGHVYTFVHTAVFFQSAVLIRNPLSVQLS